MRIADLQSGSARLRDSTDKLFATWGEVRETWKDANSRHLEEERLRPIADEVSAALAAIRHLAEVIDKAQRECESW